MLFPCEFVVKKILPAIRAAIVKELYETYNLKQQMIAKKLGITQPSVSLYLSGDRGGFEEIFDKIDKDLITKMAKQIALDEDANITISQQICNMCNEIRLDGTLLELFRQANPGMEQSICKLCWGSPE